VLRDLTHEADPIHPHRFVDAVHHLHGFGEEFTPGAVAKLELYKGERPSSTCTTSTKRCQALARPWI